MQSLIQRLYSALAGRRQAPVMTNKPQLTEAMIETGAELIYEAMRWAAQHAERGQPPEWVPGGNAIAQYEARNVAREVLIAARQSSEGVVARAIELLESTPIGDVGSNIRPRLSWEEKRDEVQTVIAGLRALSTPVSQPQTHLLHRMSPDDQDKQP